MGLRLAALVSGFVFGLGLAVSEMVNPAKVLAFLDVAGDWDPSLAFVMGGAVVVGFIAFRVTGRRARPILGDSFHLSARRDVDARLIGGAAIFGVGWGLIGLCPGPAIASFAYGRLEPVWFVIAMLVGMGLARALDKGHSVPATN